MRAARVKPATPGLLTVRVRRSEQISTNFQRVTVGGADLQRFAPLGFDQWFRLFIPVDGASLGRLPNKLDTLSYLKFLAIAKASRPILRNYTVRSFRPGPDPELDIDFVLHGSTAAGTAGPAATWAVSCRDGDAVAILDEGISFNPSRSGGPVILVADATGLPAVAGILQSLPPETAGCVVIEIPAEEDRQALEGPAGVTVDWVVGEPGSTPGLAALAAATAAGLPAGRPYGWTVGEQSQVAEVRRHWVRTGVPKADIMFCGYWKHQAS